MKKKQENKEKNQKKIKNKEISKDKREKYKKFLKKLYIKNIKKTCVRTEVFSVVLREKNFFVNVKTDLVRLNEILSTPEVVYEL